MESKEKLKEMICGLGADVCGVANIDRFSDAPAGFSPLDLFPQCKSVISFGVALPKGIFEVSPRLIYAHFNGDVICAEIDRIALLASRKIEKDFGCKAVPVPGDAPNEYWVPESLTAKGLISMKHTAVACGLGQLGKNTLLLNPQYGNRLTIGAVLTDFALDSDKQCKNICIPGCRKCIENCPVQAISAGNVNQSKCRPHTYGKTARGFGTVDCNRCRSVCPMRDGIR
jgi:epoxyqueuosine reductase QueG